MSTFIPVSNYFVSMSATIRDLYKHIPIDARAVDKIIINCLHLQSFTILIRWRECTLIDLFRADLHKLY